MEAAESGRPDFEVEQNSPFFQWICEQYFGKPHHKGLETILRLRSKRSYDKPKRQTRSIREAKVFDFSWAKKYRR